MYPGTIVNWYDQSEFPQENTIAEVDNSPLFMVVSSFDKGPEELMEVSGEDFNSLFGTMYFDKHGQNAIQAQRIINAGGRLLVKRVVAEDSTLANIVFTATVTAAEEQKVDEDGNKIYLDENGEETTTESENPVIVKTASVKWAASSIAGCKTFEEVETKVLEMLDEEAGVYPVMFFVDNGRGSSKKAIRLIPDYNTSKGVGQTFYTGAVFEGTTSTESTVLTFNPDVIQVGNAYGLTKETMTQVRGEVIPVVYEAYVSKLATSTEIPEETLKGYDLIYGYTYKGESLSNITIDAESIDMNTDFGVELKEGSNGEFGDKPVETDAWKNEMIKVWKGQYTEEVWDVDTHKICAVVDANLPFEVKEAISEFVNFRQDCVFFRDLGLDLDTFTAIQQAYDKNTIRSRFISEYFTS